MMLRPPGRVEAADLVAKAMVSRDLARFLQGVNAVSCSGFGDVLIEL
jgi:hypothetical protein